MTVATIEVRNDAHSPLTCTIFVQTTLTEDAKQHSDSSKVVSPDRCTKSMTKRPSHHKASEAAPKNTKMPADIYIVRLVSSKSDGYSENDEKDFTYKDLIGFKQASSNLSRGVKKLDYI